MQGFLFDVHFARVLDVKDAGALGLNALEEGSGAVNRQFTVHKFEMIIFIALLQSFPPSLPDVQQSLVSLCL